MLDMWNYIFLYGESVLAPGSMSSYLQHTWNWKNSYLVFLTVWEALYYWGFSELKAAYWARTDLADQRIFAQRVIRGVKDSLGP